MPNMHVVLTPVPAMLAITPGAYPTHRIKVCEVQPLLTDQVLVCSSQSSTIVLQEERYMYNSGRYW
jgi:hypothetical protein